MKKNLNNISYFVQQKLTGKIDQWKYELINQGNMLID